MDRIGVTYVVWTSFDGVEGGETTRTKILLSACCISQTYIVVRRKIGRYVFPYLSFEKRRQAQRVRWIFRPFFCSRPMRYSCCYCLFSDSEVVVGTIFAYARVPTSTNVTMAGDDFHRTCCCSFVAVRTKTRKFTSAERILFRSR